MPSPRSSLTAPPRRTTRRLSLRCCALLGALALVTHTAPAEAALVTHGEVITARFLFSSNLWNPDAFPMQLVFVGDPPDGMSTAQVEASIRAAAQTWTSVTCSSATIEYAGRKTTLEELGPEEVGVAFIQRDHPCFLDSARFVAITSPLCQRRPATILLNAQDFAWSTSPHYAELLAAESPYSPPQTIVFQAALTHELGHALGLAHTPDNPADPLATMAATYVRDGGQSTLAADDRFGLCALFPASARQETCLTDALCQSRLEDPAATCIPGTGDSEGTSVCQEERSPVGAFCAHDMLRCDGVCRIDVAASGTGHCTRACTADEDCPGGWTCTDTPDLPGTPRACAATGEADPSTCSAAPTPQRVPLPSLLLLAASIGLLTVRRRATHPRFL